MFNFWGSKDQQQGQSRPQEASSQSPWYSPSLVSSPSSSRPQSSGQISAQVSPGEAAGIIVFLKDKSVDELRKLLSDKDAYQQFLLSLDQVKVQNNIKDELRRETLQLASKYSMVHVILQETLVQSRNLELSI
jgi:ESCRT-I complex subunit VPS37